MDSLLLPPQSPQGGFPDNRSVVARSSDETTRPTDIPSRGGRGNGTPQRHRSSISWDAHITPPPRQVDRGQESPSHTREQNRPRPPALHLLPPHEYPASSPLATFSSCSSLTRIDDEEFFSRSDQPAERPNFSKIFVASPSNIASHGIDIAQSNVSKYDDLSMEGAIKNLCAIDMQDYERYKRGYCYPLNHYSSWKSVIAPGPYATSLNQLPPPQGWKAFIHPEGTKYFYCDDLSSPVPVITEAWLDDDEVREAVECYILEIFHFMHDKNVHFRRREGQTQSERSSFAAASDEGEAGLAYFQDLAPIVLVLEARLTGKFGYYFVDHRQRRLFWLDKYDFSWSTGEVHIEHTERSMGLEMKSQYWKHVEHFPDLYEFTLDDLTKIDNMISFTFGDVLTSDTSAVGGYSMDQLRDVREIMNSHKQKTLHERRQSVGERRTICRVVGDFYHERFLNLHGERGVRLDSKQSIYYSPHRRKKLVKRSDVAAETNGGHPWYKRLLPAIFFSPGQDKDVDEIQVDADPLPSRDAKAMHSSSLLMNVATFFMFGGPYVHASRLRDMTLDQIVNRNLLAMYTAKMVAEWRDVALYGTVLLGANVSFLTIQSVDDASRDRLTKTAAQRASYFSILSSLGTIVASLVLLILVRHREVMGNKLIRMRSQSRWGLEALALMYGTPFSLVIWAILGFFISFAILWFECRDGVVIAIVVISSVSFAIFLGWAVTASYCEREPYELVVMGAAGKVQEVGEIMREGAKDAAGKMSTAGATVRRGTLDMANGAKRRFSTLKSPVGSRRKRSRSQNPDYAQQLSEPPGAIIDGVSGPGRAVSLELQSRKNTLVDGSQRV